MTSPFAHTCLCGKRIGVGQRCPVCEKRPTEAQRFAHNPNRASYRDPVYRANRMARYALAGGRCECGCRMKLKGPLWPEGARWECHHITNPVGNRDDVVNLRCLYHAHHSRYTK